MGAPGESGDSEPIIEELAASILERLRNNEPNSICLFVPQEIKDTKTLQKVLEELTKASWFNTDALTIVMHVEGGIKVAFGLRSQAHYYDHPSNKAYYGAHYFEFFFPINLRDEIIMNASFTYPAEAS